MPNTTASVAWYSKHFRFLAFSKTLNLTKIVIVEHKIFIKSDNCKAFLFKWMIQINKPHRSTHSPPQVVTHYLLRCLWKTSPAHKEHMCIYRTYCILYTLLKRFKWATFRNVCSKRWRWLQQEMREGNEVKRSCAELSLQVPSFTLYHSKSHRGAHSHSQLLIFQVVSLNNK